MSFFKKITKAVSNIYDSTIGDIINPSNYLTREITGLTNTQQLGVGATVGTANGILNGSSEGSILNNLFGDKGVLGSLFGTDNNSGLLGSIFGAGENSLGSILGSVVKGAVGVGADYFTNQQYYKDQRRLNEQTFAQNRQLADEAYQRDVAMWNLQNAYNAPKEQMARLSQAGLNPNLVYGSGNVTGNTAGSPPSYPQIQAPTSKAQKLDLVRNVLGIFDDYQRIQNQALENQREAARIALSKRSLELQEERERNKEKNDERRFQIMMANLGFTERAQDRLQESLAWKQYQDDLKDYNNREEKLPYFGKYWLKKYLPRVYNKQMGRRPMWMDYQ